VTGNPEVDRKTTYGPQARMVTFPSLTLSPIGHTVAHMRQSAPRFQSRSKAFQLPVCRQSAQNRRIRIIRDRLGPALAGIAAGTLRSNAHEDAQIAQNAKPLPLLLFSHGLGGFSCEYSIQLEDLASHGYVIAAVEHIYDSLGVVLPDGSVVAFDGQLWAKYESLSSLETVRFYEQRATVWAEDLLFPLRELCAFGKRA
jgi:hypothetical protein